MNKLISVVIPVYNRESYIAECLNSVLEQTYQNFEIILVDDGSMDKTLSICETFAEKDNRINIFSGGHKGVSSARNLALDNAKGEYIFFLDSDDIIHPQTLEFLVRAIQNGTYISIIKGKDIKQQIWDDYILMEKAKMLPLEDAIVYTNEQAVENFFEGNSTLGRMGGILFSKDYIGETRFNTDLHIGEDVNFIYENIIKGSNVAIIEQRGYFWRWHDNKLSGDVSFEGFLSRLYSKELLWKREIELGRYKYANEQKKSVFKVFVGVQKRNKLFSSDSKKTRKTMREYKKEILPIMSFRGKIDFIFAVYIYWLYFPFLKIKGNIKKFSNKKV